MTTLKSNIVANLAGGGWIAVLTLIVTPLQVNLLGMESYGLIGFIVTLQLMVSVLDLGLASTITREFAGDHSPDRMASQPLLRTALSVYWGLALLIGVLLAASAERIGRAWLNPEAVNLDELAHGLQIIAIILALRWPVALYSGVLAGVQRMVVLNVTKAAVVSARLLGSIVVLLMWADLTAFLIWTAFSALAEVLTFATVCRRMLPTMDWRPGFSLTALRTVWGFSLRMNGLALLGMGITQLDRLLISKMLPMEDLGYYSLAYSTAVAISLVLAAFSSALMPSFATAFASNVPETLVQRYENATRVVLFATGLVFFTLVFFGKPLLHVWINPTAASGAWRPLALLAGGFWLSAAVSNAYNVGVACRQPGPLLRVSVLSAVIYVPALYVMISAWGIEGAAASWLLLNAGYVVTMVPKIHRVILGIPVQSWFSGTLFPFALLGTATFGCARLFASILSFTPGFELMMLLLAVIAYIAVGLRYVGHSDLLRLLWRASKAQ